jgi:hypothetical protein
MVSLALNMSHSPLFSPVDTMRPLRPEPYRVIVAGCGGYGAYGAHCGRSAMGETFRRAHGRALGEGRRAGMAPA